jgi:fructose-1-phosphate kinase PfkB-like protein
MRAPLRAGPAVVAANVAKAEKAVGHEFNEPADLLLGLQGLIEMGARQAIITREAGCVAIVGEPAERRRYEVEIEPFEPVSTVGSGDAFPGYLAGSYWGCVVAQVARLRRGLRRRVHPPRPRRDLDPGEVERLLPGSMCGS